MDAPFLLLDNEVQNYAWGSHFAIAEMLGRTVPSALPEAELWIGAHPKSPSRILEPSGLETLDQVIAADPVAVLGAAACQRFGNELPFLFKILAAAEPLSIQAHPNQDQARRGWNRENAAGVPLDAPHRNYRDPNHKPELVSALGPFVALKGFRSFGEITRRLDPVVRPELSPEWERLAQDPGPQSLRSLFARLLTLDATEKEPLLARARAGAGGRGDDEAWRWVARLLERYPSDLGVLAPLYLNLVILAPGEALFLPAGELHAYLEGTALELMANSDNVLRGGLTPKHVDAPELLDVLTFRPRPPEILAAVATGSGESTYRTTAREFELGLLDVTPSSPFRSAAGRGVEILLGLEGETHLRVGRDAAPLSRGRSVVVPARTDAYELDGKGRVARARVPV